MNAHSDLSQREKNRIVPNLNSQNPSKSQATFQFSDQRPKAILQKKLSDIANNSTRADKITQLQSMANNTGLPNNLKTGIENLSGYSMNDVKVHYNSDKPAQLNAHAFAQGTQIHLASGQEKHLPHEAWHVVQQKQGRVNPTMQMKGGTHINDDSGLEKEADIMGRRSLQLKSTEVNRLNSVNLPEKGSPLQRVQKRGEEIELHSVPLYAIGKSSIDSFFSKGVALRTTIYRDEHLEYIVETDMGEYPTPTQLAMITFNNKVRKISAGRPEKHYAIPEMVVHPYEKEAGTSSTESVYPDSVNHKINSLENSALTGVSTGGMVQVFKKFITAIPFDEMIAEAKAKLDQSSIDYNSIVLGLNAFKDKIKSQKKEFQINVMLSPDEYLIQHLDRSYPDKPGEGTGETLPEPEQRLLHLQQKQKNIFDLRKTELDVKNSSSYFAMSVLANDLAIIESAHLLNISGTQKNAYNLMPKFNVAHIAEIIQQSMSKQKRQALYDHYQQGMTSPTQGYGVLAYLNAQKSVKAILINPVKLPIDKKELSQNPFEHPTEGNEKYLFEVRNDRPDETNLSKELTHLADPDMTLNNVTEVTVNRRLHNLAYVLETDWFKHFTKSNSKEGYPELVKDMAELKQEYRKELLAIHRNGHDPKSKLEELTALAIAIHNSIEEFSADNSKITGNIDWVK